MHPAYSVIFLTTASGAGYGMLIWMGCFSAAGLLPRDPGVAMAGLGIAFALVTFGLLASTAHLGRPERAWRAITQWRSSWLSREGIMALATYLPAIAFGAGWTLHGTTGGPWSAWGLLTAFASAVTVWCTAMIYASLVAIPRWHNPWVVPVYLAFALYSGGLWLLLVLDMFGAARPAVVVWVLAFAASAAGCKWAYWRSIDRAEPGSTAGTATGLGDIGPVRLLAEPHSGENYLLREMGYRVARRHGAKLRRLAAVTGFGIPGVALILHLVLGPAFATALAVVAALAGSFGIVVERWLFFAEARHKVMLYYGDAAV